ncbi:hypothetical protein SDC9_205792 [bioreactor metagenome]|uniref:Uncharacterized protein n=1 Tax=bioreactor metagenome TaxID=1076179 RepID=A0A645J391_9ZZZZ
MLKLITSIFGKRRRDFLISGGKTLRRTDCSVSRRYVFKYILKNIAVRIPVWFNSSAAAPGAVDILRRIASEGQGFKGAGDCVGVACVGRACNL